MDEIDNIEFYNPAIEKILAESGEQARGYAWLHQKCEAIQSRISMYLTIPTIILSTLVGATSIGSTTLFGDDQRGASVGIGSVSIAVGILQTLQSTFGFSKKAEGHRIAHLNYTKLYSFLSIELALPRNERMRAGDLLKVTRETMERLAETSPPILSSVLERFKTEFSTYDVSKPIESNGLAKVHIFTQEVREPSGSFRLRGETRHSPEPRPTLVVQPTTERLKVSIPKDDETELNHPLPSACPELPKPGCTVEVQP